MSYEYDSRQSQNLHCINAEAQNEPELVSQVSEDELHITDAFLFCEKLCEEFNRRWNMNEHFYRSKQRRATRLFLVQGLAIASDSERTVSRRYPGHLKSALKAIADLTQSCGDLHKLSRHCAVVIGDPPNQECVPIGVAIIRFSSGLEAQRKSPPDVKPYKAAKRSLKR
jgi:hypothetical protein